MRVALVLAAGQSRRFGRRDKLSAMLLGRPLLLHAIDRAREAGAQRILLVGHRRVRGTDFVRAKDARLGIGASLAGGLARLRPIDREVLIFLGDMPLASAPSGLRLRAGYEAARPEVGGAPGHPMLVRAAVARRRARREDCGIAGGLRRVLTVAGSQGNLLDIDTPAALMRLRRRIAAGGGALGRANREFTCLPKPLNGLRPPRR